MRCLRVPESRSVPFSVGLFSVKILILLAWRPYTGYECLMQADIPCQVTPYRALDLCLDQKAEIQYKHNVLVRLARRPLAIKTQRAVLQGAKKKYRCVALSLS